VSTRARGASRGVFRPGLLAALILAVPAAGAAGSTPPTAIDTLCRQIAARINGFDADQCLQAGLRSSSAVSAQGRPLVLRDVPPAKPGAHARRVLVLGGIHGDEFSAVVVAFQWIERLRGDRFQRFQWRILPSANPDGLLAPQAHRTNAHGVDLNRNFPTPDWNTLAVRYWKNKTRSDPRRFPGKQGGSEPETRWLMEQIASYKPDAIVSIHAPLNVLDFDGPYTPPAKLGYLRLAPLGTYPGSLGGYGGLFLKLPVITPELPTATHTPSAEQSGRILADLIDWLNKNLPAGG